MAQFISFLKNKRVRKSTLFLILFVFPISAVYTAWLTDSWIFGGMDDEDGPITPEERANMEHIGYNLKNVKCPAREGRKLLDYWECLWRTSITTEGMEQHRRILAENMAYSYDTSDSHRKKILKPRTRKKREVSKKSKKRVKRQQTVDLTDPKYWYLRKFTAIVKDSALVFSPVEQQPWLLTLIHHCQVHTVEPDSSIFKFWACFRELKYALTGDYPLTYDATFQTTEFPKIENEYEEFKLLELQDIYNSSANYTLKIEFKRLQNEDKVSSFKGADPYLEATWSDFRYQYSNLDSSQQQPSWTYKGLHAPHQWHELDNRKFYVPLRKSDNLDGIEFLSDLAQTFPGTGEIASNSKLLRAPLDPRWTKDSGYSAYTRFPIPIFTKSDLAYYKSKHLIDSSVKMKSDAADIQDIIDGLKKYQNDAQIPISFEDPVSGNLVQNPVFTKEEQVPFVQAYQEFITHFFEIDMGNYKANWKATNNLSSTAILHTEYELVRRLLNFYFEAVITQEACIREMVDQYEFRQTGEQLEELLEKAKNADPKKGCITSPDETTAINIQPLYSVVESKLKGLYKSYFDRKNARQRYSLPRYPLEYKICSETDQSPIDILTRQGRQSSLKDYIFGDAAYKLAKFFMFFPIDSSTLLTVGVVGGERQDDSAVRLTGGAVKGQPLSFQYMHIRFANNWKAIGSEHWIDGKGAAMELQMVFTIAGSADTIKYWHVLARVQNQLFQFRGKLVIIISILVDVLGTDEQVEEKIAKDELNQDPYLFEPLAQAAYHFRDTYVNTTQRPRGYVSEDAAFRFIDFIPRKSGNFYTYRGSLSWPPCFGYVIWSVYEQRLYMSKRQFDQFVKIPAYGIHTNNLANDNFRKQDDIYVGQEHDSTLDYETILLLKRQRTVDRHILVGYHDVAETKETVGIVGDEIYYANEDSGAATQDGQSLLVILSFAVYFKSYSN